MFINSSECTHTHTYVDKQSQAYINTGKHTQTADHGYAADLAQNDSFPPPDASQTASAAAAVGVCVLMYAWDCLSTQVCVCVYL